MIYIGVDPGATGAIASIHAHGDARDIELHDMPYVGGEFDARKFQQILEQLANRDSVKAAIEQQQAFPKQGVVSVFKLGMAYAAPKAVLESQRISLTVVRPTDWKKGLGIPAKSDKEASRATALRLYPERDVADMLTRKADHGRAEALLIAEWLRVNS